MRTRRRFLRSLHLLACLVVALLARAAPAAAVTLDPPGFVVSVAGPTEVPPSARAPERRTAEPRQLEAVQAARRAQRALDTRTSGRQRDGTADSAPSRDLYLLHCSLLC